LFSISALDSFSFEFAVTVWRGRQRSVEHAALVGGDHVLNVNECIISSVCLEKLEGLHDEVTKVKLLALTVVDLVTLVQVLGLEQVHDGEDLTVVRHQGFSNGVTASDELLKNLQASRNDITVAGVQRSYISHKRVSLNYYSYAISARVIHVCMRKEEKYLKSVTYS